MSAPWLLPLTLTRLAVSTAASLPGRAVGLAGDVVDLVGDLSSSAERIGRLLDVVEALPPRVVAVVDQVEDVLAELGPLPPRIGGLLTSIEDVPPRLDGLLTSIEVVPPRLDGLLTSIEDVPPRADALLADLGGVVPQVQQLLVTVAEIVDAVRPVITSATRHTKAAGTAIGQVQGLLSDGQRLRDATEALVLEAEPLVQTAVRLDPTVLDALVSVLGHAETVLASTVKLELVDRVEAEVLPAVSALEGLVPVVARLSVVVDHLNEQVVEVGALLGGIPGAARLLKRGDARKAVDHG